MADETSNNADFIGRVVGDAKNPPETRMLTGWFGDSGEEGYRRLYTDAELSSYVDIPDDAILYTEPIRDAQPAGAVLVWIRRDAAVKQGGSAFSRAARFLQGQVQQDFASGAGAAAGLDLEKAGFHCVTQVPCGEVTGFTGKCTNEPQVGGAWPCITAPPHCAEVTGFTGKCTHQPWPNPTRYIGCTIFHCPTNDLTHIPHICNLVATGLPGCGGVNPPDKGGDPAALRAESKEGADDKEAATPVTSLLGCGYTKTWGLCETNLLGCGQTKDCPTTMPGCGQTQDCPTTMPGCGWSKNPICTDLPGCGFTKNWGACQQAAQAQPNFTPATVPTQIGCQAQQNFTPATVCTQIGCQGGGGNQTPATVCTGQNAQNVGAPASAICATNIACNFTLFCHTRNIVDCFPTLINCPHTRFEPQCFPIPKASPFCPVTPGCPFGPGPVITPNVRGGVAGVAFGAADVVIPNNTQAPGCEVSGVMICPTTIPGCTVPPTSPQFKCTQTKPPTQCTQSGPQCPTSCGPDCQSQQVNCTQVGPICGHDPCTLGIMCTVVAPCVTKTNAQLDCTFGCTLNGPNCIQPATIDATCQNPNAQQAFAAPRPIPVTQGTAGCPASDFVACSQFGGCRTQPNCDCTFFGGCPTDAQVGAAGPVTGCTQSGPQCPTHQFPCTIAGPACPPTPATTCTQFGQQCPTQPNGDCTFFGGCLTHGQIGAGRAAACAPTPGIICTQFGQQCPTHQKPCHTPGFECTMFCTQGSPGCPVTQSSPQCFGPLTAGGPQCPVHSGFNCPSAIGCQSIACNQSIACHPQGGGQQQQFGAQAQNLAALPIQPTHYFICPQHTHQIVQCYPSVVDACPTRLCTQQFVQCHPSLIDACPTRQIIQCNPSAVDACPTRIGCPTQDPAQCPPASGFNCPSALGCQSIACKPGGGGQQQQFAAAQPNAAIGFPTPATRCFICPPITSYPRCAAF